MAMNPALLTADDLPTLTFRSSATESPTHARKLPPSVRFFDLSQAPSLPSGLRPLLSGWTQGVLVHIPAGVKLETPLRSVFWHDENKTPTFFQVVVVAEAGSEITYIDELQGSPEGTASISGQIQILAHEGAKVSYFQVQNFSMQAAVSIRQFFSLGKDSQLDIVSVTLGGAQADIKTETECKGTGADVRFLGAARGDDTQKFTFTANTHHPVKDTRSAFDLLTVMADKAKAVFNGLIVIPETGVRTDAYQKNRNMILSPQASVETFPKLEIATDEVKCAHGASVSPVNFDQLYYLQARGIPPIDAELMIINGFTQPVIERLPEIASIRTRVMEALDHKHGVHPCGVTPILQAPRQEPLS